MYEILKNCEVERIDSKVLPWLIKTKSFHSIVQNTSSLSVLISFCPVEPPGTETAGFPDTRTGVFGNSSAGTKPMPGETWLK